MWRWRPWIVGLLAAASAAGAPVDYVRDVKPLLTRHCLGCHGADQQKAHLRLDTAAAARAGGDSGPAIVPGRGLDSLLVQVVNGTHATLPTMPYKKPPLASDETTRLRRWIDEGAIAPADETSGRQLHWAFVAPRRSEPPEVPADSGTGPVRHPIDRFIRDQLQREELAPSPEADRITLVRRVHLDLTGLPPTPAEVDAFLADSNGRAYERVVEALLQSPHYGERWARWWLDAARYADSNGYSIDAPRSMWPWRDWVIQALNDDLPFDRFVIEQLAGDLLPGATVAQRIATGFHRNTQINQEGGIDPEQFRIESVIDRVNTCGTVLLGLTVGCAQCHDHKFDPLSQREYFQLFAIFNNQEEPTLSLPTDAERAALDAHAEDVRRLEARLQEATGPENEDATKEQRRIEAELAQLRKRRPDVTTAMVLVERNEPRENYVFIKGDFTRRGPDVTPGTPAILHPLRWARSEARGSETNRGQLRPDRLDFARWLMDPANPLTARVTVNRVWQHYFGKGLVETENDFGTQGAPPSHPELLDWLASEFVAGGWSLKALHRLIVTSATYRQSAKSRADPSEKDPSNRWLARQNRLRLDAEIIRDVALAASGRLDPTIGGAGVFPPQPDGVMDLGQSRREWKASEGTARYRRGLYTFYWRATPHPALAVFDAPDAFSACTRRTRSNTPLQALTLLNDAAFVELAQALAERLRRDAPPEQRLELAFRLCVARRPEPAERTRLEQLLAEERHENGEGAAWQALARVVLNLDETITRE